MSTWDMYLNQMLAAVRCSVIEFTGYSPHFLLYGRDPVFPLDNLLKPTRRYMGDEAHEIALKQQHMSFAVVQHKLKKEKQRQRKCANKNRKLVQLKMGDPECIKKHQKKFKLENKWSPFYRVLEKLSTVTYLIKNQLDGKASKSKVQHLRLAPIGDWLI